MSCGDEQSSTVGQRKVPNKSLLIGIQEWEVFLCYCVKTVSTPGWHRSHRLFSFFLFFPPPGPFAPQDPLCQINLMLLCWLCVFAGADGFWIKTPLELRSEVRMKWFLCVGQSETQGCHSLPPLGSSIVSWVARWALSARCTSRYVWLCGNVGNAARCEDQNKARGVIFSKLGRFSRASLFLTSSSLDSRKEV